MATKDVLKHGENYVPTINDADFSLFGEYETYSRAKVEEKLKNVAVSTGHDWSGKKVVFEGESITMNGTSAYPEYVAEVTGCTAVKIGQAGKPIMGLYPGQSVDIRQRLSRIPADADAIIIMGDCLGPGKAYPPVYEESLASWGGRWNLAVKTIKKAFPTVPLLLVSEFPMAGRVTGQMMTAYQFEMTARLYGAIFVCLADESPLSLLYSQDAWGLNSTDGVHNNHEAMPLFADVIIKHLKEVPPYEWKGTDTLTMTTTELTVEVDKTAEIDYSIKGDLSIRWESDNTDVACVMGGTVYGMTAGTANITATTRNGNVATCAVTVTA